MWNTHYDVIIVGGGVVGCTLAHALSTIKREKPLRIAVLERSLEEPDRIVGELLQPGGVASLKELGLEWTLEGIDAVPVYGYCVVNKGKTVHIPYPDGREGRSFHHGKFIMNLREAARRAEGIFFADLVIVADGCFSNFRAPVMAEQFCKPVTKSHFVGLVLEDAVLPIPKHGTVVLVKDHGPVLLYQIAEHDTRLLIDIKQPLPADLKNHITTRVSDRIRRMPNSFLPSVKQGTRFLVGDAWNMRHPLTGGGMTVAFNDVVVLRDLLTQTDKWGNWQDWHWQRKPVASTVNILSVALYDLFGADGSVAPAMMKGISLIAILDEDLESSELAVSKYPLPGCAFQSFLLGCFLFIWCMFMHPHEKPKMLAPRLDEYPFLFFKALRVFWTACIVFGPLLWSEIRWWSPDDKKARNRAFLYTLPLPLLLGAAVAYTLQVQ
ncbi:hypothetical protein CPB85DRAFT_1333980 [Mucidula mucida]|nr:hypothetical protein CPB85DRAFT_1333980 [Mucidula mucida]